MSALLSQGRRRPVAVMREDTNGVRHTLRPEDLQVGDLVNVEIHVDIVLITGTIWSPFTAVFFAFDEVVVLRSRQELTQVRFHFSGYKQGR